LVVIEIAKLRFFLTLVVDERIDDKEDNRGILPLPNLDFKFVAANTLIPAPEIDNAGELDLDYYPEFFNDFTALTENYFYARTPSEKHKIKDQLSECVSKKIKGELNKVRATQGMDLFKNANLSASKRKNMDQKRKMLIRNMSLWESYKNIFTGDSVGFFDSKYMFPDSGVGFDVVLGNPPYVQLQGEGGKLASLYSELSYETFTRTGDIYCLFYERGYQLLRRGGHLCYITSNKWMRAGYGKAIRKFFATHTQPVQLIDFAGQKIFESATVDTNILLFRKKNASVEIGSEAIAVKATTDCRKNLQFFVQQKASPIKFCGEDSWIILSPIEQSIKCKIDAVGTPLKDCGCFGVRP
jgi:hypothetical protein